MRKRNIEGKWKEIGRKDKKRKVTMNYVYNGSMVRQSAIRKNEEKDSLQVDE